VQSALGIEPYLVHVDHRLRPSSAADAERALELAAALGLSAVTRRLENPATGQHPGVGIEEAARRERYRILRAAATERGAAAVVTAHHQADQAETVLLHLLRGGGLHGAAGMAERSTVPFPTACDISRERDESIWLWRPFLTEPRAEIDVALERLGIVPIEDPSNDDVTLRRNALRHELMPLLEARFPGAQAALARFAALAADDDALLEAQAAEALSGAVDPGGHLLPARFASYPLALQRRLIRSWVHQATGLPFLSAERTEAILTLAGNREGGKMVEIGEGWVVRRERGRLTADRGAGESPERV
jgi:tRNA(Ile)-lysidine synthase